MREILFRGKQMSNGKWIEGFYFKQPNPMTEDGFPTRHCISDLPPFGAEVILETVGQYTGLCDKNGKKIFEGDICQTKGFPLIDDKPFVVEWNDDECSFYWRDVVGTDEFNIGVSQNTTIIGNIHDNPELLKGGAE